MPTMYLANDTIIRMKDKLWTNTHMLFISMNTKNGTPRILKARARTPVLPKQTISQLLKVITCQSRPWPKPNK